MVDEIARLGVAVDSSPAVSASRDLDQLAAAGDRADRSTQNLTRSWQGASFSSGKILSVRQSVRNFTNSLEQARQEANKLSSEWNVKTFNDRQLYSVNQALNRYKQELKEVRASSQQVASAAAVQATSHHQVAKAAAGYTKTAKELAFANRNLPAQFTDIAVSLQAGQSPLTVFLQQGGQIKDMYGGAGLALRAMTSYVVGLITPVSVLAAALGSMVIAAHQGEKEVIAINKALILQGETLGVTTDQLSQQSAEMARWGQTQKQSSAALIEVVNTGKIFGDSMRVVAQTAIDMQRSAGVAIEDTVEDFAKLADKPLESALELDKQYKFLTQSTYDQIRALQEQGDEMGATRVATDALANTLNSRTQEIDENLGTLERTWRSVANAAKWAWDQMLNIGRPDTVAAQIEEITAKIEEISNPSNFMSYTHLGRKGSEQRKQTVAQLQEELRGLQETLAREQQEAEQKFVQEQGRIASLSLAEQARQGQSNAEKRIYERARIEEQITRAIAGIVAESEEDRVRQETAIRENGAKAITAMEERLRDPRTSSRQVNREAQAQAREYERLDKALLQHQETLRAAGDARDRLSSFERWAIRTLSDLDTEYSNLSEAQKDEVRNRIENLRVLDRENTERERQIRAMSVVDDLTRRIADTEAAQHASMDSELRGMGMGREQAALANNLEQIAIRAQQERVRLAERMGDLNSENTAEYLEGLRQINESEQRQLDAELEHWNRRRAAMMDWRNGARAAMDEIEMASWDVAGQTKDAYLTAFSAMNNALSNFAETGKLKIRDFATVVIAELTRIALTIALSRALTAMFGQYGGQAGFDPSASINVGSAYSGGGQVGTAARGAVVAAGRLHSMARGGVRTSPTLTPLANGDRVLWAEQAPEAIMPLARGPDGKLGVRAGGGGGTTFNVNTHVIVNNDGSTNSRTDVSTSDEATARDGRRIAQAIEEKVRETLVREQRQGGILWNMRHR